MLIPNELIISSKEKYGEKAAEDIREYFQLENWDETNLKGSCPFGHSDTTPSFIWNFKTSSFHCFSCKRNFGILDLYMLQGDTFLSAVQKLFKDTGIEYRFGEKGMMPDKKYVYPKREFSEDRSTVDEYWEERKISKITLDFVDIQQDKYGNTVFHYYDLNDVLCVVKYRPSKKIKNGENKFWAQKDASTIPLLYGINQIDTTQPLLITEGEPDRLAAIESGYKNAVSVPFGATNYTWIQHNWVFLEKFSKVIIWSDSDEPGASMRKECCTRLGLWRCVYVDCPPTMPKDGKDVSTKDANEVLYHFGKDKVIELINTSQEFPITGVSDLANLEDFDLELAPGLYTKIEPIDKIIYKLLFGSVVILTGKTGSGKSSLMNQIFVSESLNQGYDIFCYSGELDGRVLKSWVDVNIAGREYVKMKNDFVHVINSNAKKLIQDWYRERIWLFDENTNDYERILETAVNVIRKYGTKIVLIDNLMCLNLHASDNNQLKKETDFINEICDLAELYNVLIVLVAHPRKTAVFQKDLGSDDIAGTANLGNRSQYILSVKRFSREEKEGEKDKKGNYLKGKEAIDYDVLVRVIKNRYTGKLGDAHLYFSYPDYRFYSNLNELYKRYSWNKDTSLLPTLDPRKEKVPEWLEDREIE